MELPSLVEHCEKIRKKKFNKPLELTKSDLRDFKKAKRCWTCEEEYTAEDYEKDKYGRAKVLRDHCHITGKYRGSDHKECILRLKITNKIPVVFHNLKGYDFHFVMHEIGRVAKDGKWKHSIYVKDKNHPRGGVL